MILIFISFTVKVVSAVTYCDEKGQWNWEECFNDSIRVGTRCLHPVVRGWDFLFCFVFFPVFFLRQTCNRICYMGLGVRFFFYLSWLISFSMWFELLACRLLWVINTNECVLFIFKFMFWDVQAPCNRCLFIFIINKSKDSLLFNRWYP